MERGAAELGVPYRTQSSAGGFNARGTAIRRAVEPASPCSKEIILTMTEPHSSPAAGWRSVGYHPRIGDRHAWIRGPENTTHRRTWHNVPVRLRATTMDGGCRRTRRSLSCWRNSLTTTLVRVSPCFSAAPQPGSRLNDARARRREGPPDPAPCSKPLPIISKTSCLPTRPWSMSAWCLSSIRFPASRRRGDPDARASSTSGTVPLASSCSPELNPIERLWELLQHRATHNRLFVRLSELTHALGRALHAPGSRKRQLLSLININGSARSYSPCESETR